MTDTTAATHRYDPQRPPLVLHEISVLRAPGISSAFTLRDLSPDITIVFGPNASGKSTAARAIQAVLWPHASALKGHHLAARFAIGDEEWSIDASAGKIVRFRDGDTADAPQIAPLDDRSRYSLGLPDLLASENQPLAHAILNESSGGFDLPMIAETLGFGNVIPPRLDAARHLQAATTALAEATAAGETIQAALDQRSGLLAQRAETHEAEREIAAIDRALHYRQRLADEREIESEISDFPTVVHAMAGNELTLIADLSRDLTRQEEQLADRSRQRDRWQGMIDATGLADIPAPQDRLKALGTIHQQEGEIEVLLAEVNRNLVASVSERQSHQHRLADDLNDDQIVALDTNGIRELADIASAYDGIRARRTARDEVELWLGGVQAPKNLAALQQGVDTLETRLQHPNAAEHRELTGNSRWIGISGGLLLAGAGAVMAISLHPWWWALVAFAVLLIGLAWRFTTSASPKLAATLERNYAALALPMPQQWRAAEIQRLLDELRGELKIALVEQEKAVRWQELEHERAELDAAYAETESRREQAIVRFGVAPDLKEESLRLLADNLGRWQAVDAAIRGLEARQARLLGDLDTLHHRAGSILAELGYDHTDVGHVLDDVQRRIEALQEASAERDALQREIDEQLQPQLHSLIRRRDTLYRQAGLEPGDDTGLQRLLEQHQQLLAAKERLQHCRQSTREAWEALSLAPQWREEDVPQLIQSRNQAQSVVDRRAEIEEQIREIDQRERSALRSRNHELAHARVVAAQGALAEDRDRIAASVVGDLLLTTVQQETRDAALPIVFHRARELFAIITRGKYELQFEAGPPPEFTSLDTSSGLSLSLDQLSSGTRVQLLMAIRLAFVENVEIGPRLPVILDETLGNSDEFRASAIIDAAIDICKHGRQVFYFTAQGDEVARWQHRVEAMPAQTRPAIRVIELADVRRDAGFERLPLPKPETSRAAALPSPADYDAETWAATLRVPAIDPWAPIGGVHLWHLMTDHNALHTLLSQDIVTFGQLNSLERTNLAQLALLHPQLPDQLQAIHTRADLLRDAMQMWRIGRARPMPRGALAEAEMIDQSDLDELQTLAQRADNDGGVLMAHLQTMDDPPLAEKPLEALELWMISEGFVAQGQAMTINDIRARLIGLGSAAIRAGEIEAQTIEHLVAQVTSW